MPLFFTFSSGSQLTCKLNNLLYNPAIELSTTIQQWFGLVLQMLCTRISMKKASPLSEKMERLWDIQVLVLEPEFMHFFSMPSKTVLSFIKFPTVILVLCSGQVLKVQINKGQ